MVLRTWRAWRTKNKVVAVCENGHPQTEQQLEDRCSVCRAEPDAVHVLPEPEIWEPK